MRLPATPGQGLVSVVVGDPSPLLAEGPGCGSPPLLAGVRWWWWCVVPRHSWLRVLVAVLRPSWQGSAGRGGGGGFHVLCVFVPRCLCVVPLSLCVLCVCGVCVRGGVGGVVWVCLPRALVCMRPCVSCFGGLWLLVPASLGWGLLLGFMWVWCRRTRSQ